MEKEHTFRKHPTKQFNTACALNRLTPTTSNAVRGSTLTTDFFLALSVPNILSVKNHPDVKKLCLIAWRESMKYTSFNNNKKMK